MTTTLCFALLVFLSNYSFFVFNTAQDSRERTVSDRSEVFSEDESSVICQLLAAQYPNKRKPIVRSLTEVRPDAFIFDNGQHIEYRYSEDDDSHEKKEHLDNISVAGKDFFLLID